MNTQISDNLENLPLQGDEFERYFAKIGVSFETLLKIYKKTSVSENEEEEIVRNYLKRFLNSMQCLRMKYLYSDKELKINSCDSGFPSHYEFSSLETDMTEGESKIKGLLPQLTIKRKIIDSIFENNEDPIDLLKKMSERTFLDMLFSKEQFHLFSPGNLIRLNNDKEYMYYWATFDYSTNIPYIYIMVFETSYDEVFHESEEAMQEFFKTVKSNGTRAPNLNIVAVSIDEELRKVHPKIIKRISIGPFYAEGFSSHSNDEINSLLSLGDTGRRFIILMRHEHVFSAKQVISNSFFRGEQKREIFHVPEYDTELYSRGISNGESIVILPYEIHQQAGDIFDKSRIFSFDKEGNLNYVWKI